MPWVPHNPATNVRCTEMMIPNHNPVPTQEPATELRSAAAMFVQYDMDRDGVIGFQEFLLAMSSLAQRAGRSLSTERVQKLFSVADLDSNGAVDFGDFLQP
mmetsp:Transcript_60409/g.145239  ORF Transcript_60409/g.145239 Transcript_60409/m.145239 type:complete len:101 (+) Transcript_60409:275-577(+)